MAYLHRQAVVHGDLKSGNVLLHTSVTSPYGRLAKITDFGLSRAMATGETHRSTHTLGTVSSVTAGGFPVCRLQKGNRGASLAGYNICCKFQQQSLAFSLSGPESSHSR